MAVCTTGTGGHAVVRFQQCPPPTTHATCAPISFVLVRMLSFFRIVPSWLVEKCRMPVDPNADRAGSKSPRGNGVHNKRSAFQCPAEKHGSRPVVPLVVRLHVLLLHPGAYLKLSDFYVFRSRLSQEHVLVPRPRVPMRCNSRCCYCSQPCFDAFEGADFPVYVRLTRGPPSPL